MLLYRRHPDRHDEPGLAFAPIGNAHFRAEERLGLADFCYPYLQGAFDGRGICVIECRQLLLVAGGEMPIDDADIEDWHVQRAFSAEKRS